MADGGAMPSASMPASKFWIRCRRKAGPTATCWPPAPGAPASTSPKRTIGRIFFRKVLAARVEPRLGLGRPTMLIDYPRVEAALARPKPDDGRLAERFELYACGVELANGFGELTDPVEQRARFTAEMDEKERMYGERYPLDEDFLAALAQMPPASGVALGFDRLVMLATGAPNIERRDLDAAVAWPSCAIGGWPKVPRTRQFPAAMTDAVAPAKAVTRHRFRGAVRDQLLPSAQ